MHFDSFNSSIKQLAEFLSALNQSLATSQFDEPIRDQITFCNISEELRQSVNETKTLLMGSRNNFRSIVNQSEGNLGVILLSISLNMCISNVILFVTIKQKLDLMFGSFSL